MLHQLLLFLHLVGMAAWVGGMFFAYFCLRPAAAAVLDPPLRLPLWAATFRLFLRYTALAVALVVGSGFAMIARAGFAQAPPGWHAMMALGLAMTAVYAVVALRLYPRFAAHCAAAAWPAAAQVLNGIRRLVALNLILALITVGAATSAR